jgi:hypothetical protein
MSRFKPSLNTPATILGLTLMLLVSAAAAPFPLKMKDGVHGQDRLRALAAVLCKRC